MFMGAEAVAAGIGAVATVVFTATAVDVTGGFIAAGIVALVGLIFLPRQKRKAIAEFNDRTTALREDMRKALVQQLDEEVDSSLARVSDTVAPYVKFVNKDVSLFYKFIFNHTIFILYTILRNEIKNLCQK